MTKDFKELLRLNRDANGVPFTQESWAKAMGMGRARLCQIVGNVPGRGGVMRVKVARDIKERFPTYAGAMLAILGWDQNGNLKPTGTFHVEPTSVGATMKELA